MRTQTKIDWFDVEISPTMLRKCTIQGRMSMAVRRREFLKGAALSLAGLGALPSAARSTWAESIDLPFANGRRPLVKYPGKRPLIRQTARPPQLETPFDVFDKGIITPNDAFFVRYHLAGLPTEIDSDAFRLTVKGSVSNPLSLSLQQLKGEFDAQEIVAVNQCSGNSRGFFDPRVGGGQLGNGDMGNAKWTGVSLKAVLDKAGVLADAKQVVFNGLDVPVLPATPDFVKALDIDHARDGEVMLAYAMNGEALPFLNGYPLRLVVPGYYGTYWVKHLNEIEIVDGVFEGFWMKSAYRIPANACACVEPGTAPASTVPIGRFDVRSFITNPLDGGVVRAKRKVEVRGIAFDGGYGITDVLLSIGADETWMGADLDRDFGRYSFRQWRKTITLPPGEHTLKVRAINRVGQSQPAMPLWNPSGYMRNAIQSVRLRAV
jgi:DMSO/TMAO reductase YedYZ molybdopterin-dependent catalytic subunit